MKAYFRNFVNHWAERSVYLAGLIALLAIFLPLTLTQKMLLASIMVLFLHFFEEFAWPGGFAYLGVKVLLGKDEPDQTKWNCNNLSSMYGNWGFLMLIYVLPLCFPGLKVLVLAAMMFNFAELLMHLVIFNVRLKTWYNPGFVTAVFGLTPISIYYFSTVFDASMYAWYHYVIAVVWFVCVFWSCFRSPWYWWLGKKKATRSRNRQPSGCISTNQIRNQCPLTNCPSGWYSRKQLSSCCSSSIACCCCAMYSSYVITSRRFCLPL